MRWFRWLFPDTVKLPTAVSVPLVSVTGNEEAAHVSGYDDVRAVAADVPPEVVRALSGFHAGLGET